MEATDGTTGNRDEQSREYRRGESFTADAVVQLGQRRPLDEQHGHQCHGHEQHGNGEQRVDLSDDLINRKHRGNDIIHKDDAAPDIYPSESFTAYLTEDQRRTIYKHRTYHHQEEYGEYQHHVLGGLTQVTTNQLRLSGTIISHGKHTAKVIVYCSCKDTAQHNPKIGSGTELCSHDSTEDRTCTSDIQELDHKDLPSGKDNEVNTVGFRQGRCRSVVRTKNFLNKLTIDHVAYDQSEKTQYKSNHFLCLLYYCFCKGTKNLSK